MRSRTRRAALYDGDDNRVFTANRKEGKNTYQLFQGKSKDAQFGDQVSHAGIDKSGRKSPYTAPSGHFWNSIKKGLNYVEKKASNAWNGVKSFASKAWNVTKSAFNQATNWVSTQYNRAVNWGSRQWNKVQTAYNSARDYVQQKY